MPEVGTGEDLLLCWLWRLFCEDAGSLWCCRARVLVGAVFSLVWARPAGPRGCLCSG